MTSVGFLCSLAFYMSMGCMLSRGKPAVARWPLAAVTGPLSPSLVLPLYNIQHCQHVRLLDFSCTEQYLSMA